MKAGNAVFPPTRAGRRDALAEARRTETFACEQIVGDGAARDAVLILEDQAGLFEDAFLAGD